ncbi:hypothetical protein A0256_23350 [Mucilaginibacter sp. PAMC 26640]|nr:hypothetical protein A0256_23350 [Mucilaginibacter sp. PAMC 26640]
MEPKVLQLVADISASAPAPEKTLQDLILASLIPQGIEIPKPDLVFEINGASVFTKKSLSTIIGQAKSGKTTVTSWIVSQSIQAETKVLWIDTEQGLYYGSRTQHWVLSMSGMRTCPNLSFYDLKIFSPPKRIEIVEEIIKMYSPDLVIIDGVRDLIFDINNPEQATVITGDLMRWAEEYNTHICSILHQNKGTEHARGHLGTEMINKSETVMSVEVNADKLIVCSPKFTRSAPFELFAFNRDERGMPQIVEGFSGKITTGGSDRGGKKQVDPTEPSWNAAHIGIVDYVFSKAEYLKYSELIDNICNYFQNNAVSVGKTKAREFVTHYIMVGIVWVNPYVKGNAKYQKNPKFEGFPYVAPGITIKEQEAPF